MSRDLLIDGYNLMHAAGLGRRSYGPGDLERCRNRLLAQLSQWLTAEERQRTTIVFDAKDAPAGASDWAMVQDMHVMYAPSGLEADDVVEDLIKAHSAPKKLLVVSGDHRLHRAARRRRAQVIDSERFVDRCERMVRKRQEAPAPPEEIKPSEPLDAAEIAEWMAEFGAIDVAALSHDAGQYSSPPEDDAPPTDRVPDAPPADQGEVKFWTERLRDILDDDDRHPRN